MNIVYGCDDKFAPVLYVSIATLIKFNKDSKLNIYIIDDHVSKTSKDAINKLKKEQQQIFWLPMLNINNEVGSAISFDRGSSAQFARIFIARYLPNNVDKVLYLDCDTMITASIEELWNSDLSNITFGACLDAFGELYSKNLKLPLNANLINSGVLLINLVRWRFNYKESQAIKILKENNGKLQQADQGLLDILVQNDLKILDPKFNCINGYFEFSYSEWIKYRKPKKSYTDIYTAHLIQNAVTNPVIVHFTSSFLNDRPWILGAKHPYKESWFRELNKSTLTMKMLDQTSFLKIIFEKLPRHIAINIFGILQAYLRPIFKRT